MKDVVTILVAAFMPVAALAADPPAGGTQAAGASGGESCTAQADGRKLAGAARRSFMKRCSADAQIACGDEAHNRKLAGAAKGSFTMKCARDAIGDFK